VLLWYYYPSINDWIVTYVKGHKKVVAYKKSLEAMIQEGKSAISFEGFNILCETMCSLEPTGRKFTYQELLFGWAYCAICLNTTMGRSNSVHGIMFHHITWKDDCLVITFPKSKCDQTGEGLSNDKNVYAYLYNLRFNVWEQFPLPGESSFFPSMYDNMRH
jgi:hypothetical protein